jgi:hypothetical protein
MHPQKLLRILEGLFRDVFQGTVKNREKLKGRSEASFDTQFMIQSHAESMKKILGAL